MFLLKCCFCFKSVVKQSENESKLNEKNSPKPKKSNSKLLSCFSVAEDEFDIIDTNDVNISKFNKIVKTSADISTQTETNTIEKNITSNKIENDFIMPDSNLEKEH